MSGRAVARLQERFAGAESRGSRLIDTLVAALQRLETARRYQDLGLPLPGPFGAAARDAAAAGSGAGNGVDIYEDLLPKLVAALTRRAEEILEQVRVCVEELEVVFKQINSFAATDETTRVVAYWHGQEYLRKKQVVEAAVLTDGADRFVDLQRAWNSGSGAGAVSS